MAPQRSFEHHTDIVNDVAHHPFHPALVGTVSDDVTLHILDLRQPASGSASAVHTRGHAEAINALAFSPASEYVLATGAADRTVGLWDLRNVSVQMHALEGHNDSVTSLAWHPHDEGVLGSAGYDRRVIFWDLTKIGMEQAPEDQEDGPPEL